MNIPAAVILSLNLNPVMNVLPTLPSAILSSVRLITHRDEHDKSDVVIDRGEPFRTSPVQFRPDIAKHLVR